MLPSVGDILEGRVTGVKNFGAFVDLGSGNTGLVHISEVSTSFIKDIAEVLKVGDIVKVKVLAVGEGKINLSIKALAPKKEPPKPSADERFEQMMNRYKKMSDDRLSDIKKRER